MPGPRHRARELALAALFQLEHGPEDDPSEVVAYLATEQGADQRVVDFAVELVEGVVAHREELDRMIRAAATHWSMEQMGRVEGIVLRMAAYEIAIARRVPVRAAINESIELAKTFAAGEESGRFVNGVLGRIASLVAS